MDRACSTHGYFAVDGVSYKVGHRKIGMCCVVWIHLVLDREWLTGFFEHGNERIASIKAGMGYFVAS